jgi:hypothetical protein
MMESSKKACTKGPLRHRIALSATGIAGNIVVLGVFAAVLALTTQVLNLIVKGVFQCQFVYECFFWFWL